MSDLVDWLPGCTFFNKEYDGVPTHLWVVLSDPRISDSTVLIANLTSWSLGADESCVLVPGDHPFIKRKTIIAYALARTASLQILDQLYSRRDIWTNDPFEVNVLLRIQKGLMDSRYAIGDHKRLLSDQGLA